MSTEEQQLGPEAQRQGIARWCVRHRIRLASCHVDHGVSGSSLPSDRPGFSDALAQLSATRAGWLVVLVRDRLAREAHYAGHAETIVERLGARIITTEESPGSEDSIEAGVIRAVRDMTARAEKAAIRRRITQALAVKASRGERVGSTPFGWTSDRGPRVSKSDAPARLVPHTEEQETIAIIWRLYEAGKSTTQIARLLDRMGRPCRGKEWHHMTVRRVLDRRTTTTAQAGPNEARTELAEAQDEQRQGQASRGRDLSQATTAGDSAVHATQDATQAVPTQVERGQPVGVAGHSVVEPRRRAKSHGRR